MKRLITIVAFVVLTLGLSFFIENKDNLGLSLRKDEITLSQIIKEKKSGEIIKVKGTVIKLLADDLSGDRHQKLILKTGKITLLLAHNIDVAPRIPVKEGEQIIVKGQYEWNQKGGVIHWTHRDKKNKHPHGWVLYNDKRYQ